MKELLTLWMILMSAEDDQNSSDDVSSSAMINNNQSTDGFQLPQTGSSIFNLLLIGTIITLIGGSLLLYQKYRKL